jgi:hypothetical protein
LAGWGQGAGANRDVSIFGHISQVPLTGSSKSNQQPPTLQGQRLSEHHPAIRALAMLICSMQQWCMDDVTLDHDVILVQPSMIEACEGLSITRPSVPLRERYEKDEVGRKLSS